MALMWNRTVEWDSNDWRQLAACRSTEPDLFFPIGTTGPAVDQIELHPFLQQRETRAFCEARGIVVEAYSPLTHGKRLQHASVAAVAAAVGRSNAQVLLRWGIQHGLVVLPKSTKEERIRENGAVFDFALDATQMAKLDGLDEGFATAWDPRDQA